ncbi:LOW QUALITY PROTEIN: hypothetical protein HID58_073858, partial [Brassica napus]
VDGPLDQSGPCGPFLGLLAFIRFLGFGHKTSRITLIKTKREVYGPEGRISQLYGRYGSQIGQAGIRSSLPGEPTRVTAELAGELTGVMVELAGELTGVMVELAGELTRLTVELAGELTRVTVQLSGDWLLCGIRSFSPGDATPLAESAMVPVQVPEVSAQPSGSSTTPVQALKEEKAMELMPPPLDRNEIVLGLPASSAAPLTKSRKRTGAATETIKKRRCTAGAEGEPSGPLSQHRSKRAKE